MFLAKACREAEQKLDPFEFGEPFGGDLVEDIVGRVEEAGGARRTQLLFSELAIAGEGAVAVTADLVEILTEEDDHGNALARVDGDRCTQLGDEVAVDEAERDGGRSLSEVVEDGALGDAITAPGAVEDQDGHAAAEGSEEFALRGGERDARVHSIPALALGVRCFQGEHVGIGAALRKEIGPVHDWVLTWE